jgi:hypothetical protein
MLASGKSEEKGNAPPRGEGVSLSELPVPLPETGMELLIFIVRGGRGMICKHLNRATRRAKGENWNYSCISFEFWKNSKARG